MSNHSEIIEKSKKKGILLDYCGNDERHYYNGLYTDLCGMSVEDYINSTLLNNNFGSGSGDETLEPTKKINTIIFSKNTNGYLVVYANNAPKTELNITCICDGEKINVTIPNNNGSIISTTYKITGETINVTDVSITPSEDDTYKYGDYRIINNTQPKTYTIYYNMVNTNTYNDISNNDIVNFKNFEASYQEQEIVFILPPTNENVDDLPEEEYLEWENNNSYYKSIIVPSVLYTDENNKKFELLLGGEDAFIGFKNVKQILVDNIPYYLLVDLDDKGCNSTKEEISAGTYKFLLIE